MKRYKILILSTFLFVVTTLFIGCNMRIERPGAFSDVKVALFVGGTLTSPYSKLIYAGAKAAQRDLGCRVDFISSKWDSEQMLYQFKQLMNKAYDGICIMGHPGYEQLGPLVSEAFRKGILVTSLDTRIPKLEEMYIDRGFGFVGLDTYNSGYALAQTIIQKYRYKKGDRIAVWGKHKPGFEEKSEREKRSRGIGDYLENIGISVDYLVITSAIEDDLERGRDVVKQYIDTHNDTKMIIVSHGGLTSRIASFLESAGVKPGDVVAAGFTLTEGAIQGIKNGYIGIVQDQQPYLQGYFPVLQVCLTKKYSFPGLYIDLLSGYITKHNVDYIEKYVTQGIR